MKLYLFTAVLASIVQAKDIDLAKVTSTTPGECTVEVLRIQSAPALATIAEVGSPRAAFVAKAIERAKQVYLSTTLTYIEGADPKNLQISKTRYVRISSRGKQIPAYTLTVGQGGDEDELEFFFASNKQVAPLLLMALHHQQSSEAYWTCEE